MIDGNIRACDVVDSGRSLATLCCLSYVNLSAIAGPFIGITLAVSHYHRLPAIAQFVLIVLKN